MSETTGTAINPSATLTTLVEQRIEEQAGVPLTQMTGEQAVAAMVAASSAPALYPASGAGRTAAQLLAEHLNPYLLGAGPQASRRFVTEKAGALLALVNTGRPITVEDVVEAILGGGGG